MSFGIRFIGAAALLSSSGFAAALSPVSVSGTPISATAISTVTASVNQSSSGSGWASQTQAWSTQTTSGSAWTSSSQAWTTSSSQAWTTSTPPAASYASSYGYGSSSSTPGYGSGSSNWGYNSCVQQCMASFGGSSTTYAPPTATSVSGYGSSGSGSSGSGATHTIIVAPTQGVLRFVPFVVNASVGDTIQFKWGANNHTVTKSTFLAPCNKTSDNPFTSGEQNQGFNFTQVVNDTNPIFFYCGTPTHCEKGMFGVINPPNALGSPTSASAMMQSLAANNSAFAAYANYTKTTTANQTAAAAWGGGINMSSFPSWAQSYAAENIMYTQNFLAFNSEVLQNDGSVNLSSGSAPWMYPQDITVAINSTGANSSATSSPSPLPSASSLGSSPSTSSAANSTSQAGSAGTSSAAISTSFSKVLFGLVVGFATFMMF